MHWNKSVFHNFYQQGHHSDAHKNEKDWIISNTTIERISNHSHPKKGKGKPLKFNFKSPAAKTFGSLSGSKSGFGSWANKAIKLKTLKNRNNKNAKLRKEYHYLQNSKLFQFWLYKSYEFICLQIDMVSSVSKTYRVCGLFRTCALRERRFIPFLKIQVVRQLILHKLCIIEEIASAKWSSILPFKSDIFLFVMGFM